MKTDCRFAVQILFFDCDQFILRTIANCAPYVEKIYVTYSPEPWSAYNKKARSVFKNPSDPSILRESPYFSKIELIEGVWDTEEDQRNACLRKAKLDGFDFLIIQDADEFYLPEEYKKNLEGIKQNPDVPYYRNPWYFFWKTTEYIILNRHFLCYGNHKYVRPYFSTPTAFNACFAINCRQDIWFFDKRLPKSSDSPVMLMGVCFHLSYVLSDESLLRKLSTWGHSHQVNIDEWFNVKWLGWTLKSKNLHPINLVEWPRVIKYTGTLPKELEGFHPGEQGYSNTSVKQSVRDFLKEKESLLVYILKDIKFLLMRAVKFSK